ncbi:MAG: hypothetical protein ACFCUL_06960 [Flavobacteriaceae bacterium]
MEPVIAEYISNNNREFQRYNSWNHCFEAFGTLKDEKLLSLHLGFYLASWGMYRGSSKLLERDFLVHLDAVEIIKNHKDLRCNSKHEVSLRDVDTIRRLIKELSAYYKNIHSVTPTDTLISKIILGTLGCLPAFDRFFLDGVKEHGYDFKSLNEKSLISLFDFSDKNKDNLGMIQKKYPLYPLMKLVDMYFWQVGFERYAKRHPYSTKH